MAVCVAVGRIPVAAGVDVAGSVAVGVAETVGVAGDTIRVDRETARPGNRHAGSVDRWFGHCFHQD